MKDRIKELRKSLGLKQREFAEKLGVTTGLVGSWESGIHTPGAGRMYSMCKLFGVSQEWLRDGVGPMFERDKSGPSRRQVQREFCREVFRSLDPRIQRVVIDAIKEEIANVSEMQKKQLFAEDFDKENGDRSE